MINNSLRPKERIAKATKVAAATSLSTNLRSGRSIADLDLPVSRTARARLASRISKSPQPPSDQAHSEPRDCASNVASKREVHTSLFFSTMTSQVKGKTKCKQDQSNTNSSMPWLIHVGKSGGTSVASMTNLEHKHRKPPEGHRKIILWLRNPISRFVSAFNFAKAMVEEGKKIGEMSESDIKGLTLDNCPFPEKLKSQWKKKDKYVYSKTIDTLIDKFPNVSSLLEALTSDSLLNRRSAEQIMSYTNTGETFDFFKSLGWYLDNGDWVPSNRHRVIFVGTLENMDEDIRKTQRILNKAESASVPSIRKMKGTNIDLSQKASSIG